MGGNVGVDWTPRVGEAVMFFPDSRVRVHGCGRAVDLRKPFDGLYAVARTAFAQDTNGGDPCVFVNRSGRQIKVLSSTPAAGACGPNGWRPDSSSATGVHDGVYEGWSKARLRFEAGQMPAVECPPLQDPGVLRIVAIRRPSPRPDQRSATHCGCPC